MSGKFEKIELSAALTLLGVIVLFSMAVGVTLIAPEYIDPSWKQASSSYQVQMYEVSDPNVYISTSNPGGAGLQHVYHLQNGRSFLAFQESELVRILASPELESFVTRFGEGPLRLTTRLLLLRPLTDPTRATAFQQKLQQEWQGEDTPRFDLYELYAPNREEAFAVTETDGILENWVDEGNYTLVEAKKPSYEGVIYVNNPKEYLTSELKVRGIDFLVYDENGEPIPNLTELKSGKGGFLSRHELITMGENIYRIEGCWYCHTDQTRTLVQDTVLNGAASYPAPPSSANEYIFQTVTFPGTRRIGPDLSRVGIKRPHRDWHQAHFWWPQSESKGSIMPSFRHFFDDDPTGAAPSPYSLPNYKFEAVYHYLMTKGTRITPPTQAWWLGKDPIQTIDIIEGKK